MKASIPVLLLLLGLSGCDNLESPTFAPLNPAGAQVSTTVRVGALIKQDPLGDPDTQAALALAQEDINSLIGEPRVEVVVVGTDYDPDRALAGLEQMEAEGIQVVVGPETSTELAALKPEADRTGTIILSHCSTAGSLAIANDSIFRLTPSDKSQSKVLAQRVLATGASSLVQVFRDDIYGRDVSTGVRENAGLPIVASLSYDPENPDFAALAATLNEKVGSGMVVQYSGFGEDAAAFLAAASQYPNLAQVRWIGSDGTALSREILANPQAVAFAETVQLENPLFAVPDNAKSRRIIARIKARANTEVQACALASYDGVWLAYQAAVTKKSNQALRGVVPTLCDNFFGATGWMALDEAGDRAEATYDIWVIRAGEWVTLQATGV